MCAHTNDGQQSKHNLVLHYEKKKKTKIVITSESYEIHIERHAKKKLQLIKMSTDRSYICLMDWFGDFFLCVHIMPYAAFADSLSLFLFYYVKFFGFTFILFEFWKKKLAHKNQIENKSQTDPILNTQ